MMDERGISLAHTTIMRWVHKAGPLLDHLVKRFRSCQGGSWRVDETYIKIKGEWVFLYRAIDKQGNTIDFYLSRTQRKAAAKRFLHKAIRARKYDDDALYAINTDQHAAYVGAIAELKAEGKLHKDVEHRRVKYLNNRIEQDHRFIKKKMKISLSFQSLKTAYATIKGIEAMHMIRKNQLFHIQKSPRLQMNFIHRQADLQGSFI